MRLIVLLTLFLFTQWLNAQEMAESADSVWEEAWTDWEDDSTLNAFFEIGMGNRFHRDPALLQAATMRDTRLNISWQKALDRISMSPEVELVHDAVTKKFTLNVRELSASLATFEKADIKIGRQILTWGVGDYLFLNDLFPKDFQSFFNGRDDRYLKAPSDAIKFSYFHTLLTLDVIYSPRFEPDNYINGEYFSFYQPAINGNTSTSPHVQLPNGGEWSTRISTQLGRSDIALYASQGFARSPLSTDMQGAPAHHKMKSIGLSVVVPSSVGLLKAEYSYYSIPRGQALISHPPNESRWLFGIDTEIATSLVLNLQLYTEQFHNKQPHEANNVAVSNRWLLTTGLNYTTPRQYWSFKAFHFYSIEDNDGYLRLSSSYKFNDTTSITTGINYFYGKKPTTSFNQFEKASNAYVRMRWYF